MHSVYLSEDQDPYSVPPVAILGNVVAKLPVQENHPDSSRVAKHALVLGLGSYVKLDPTVPAQSADSAIQLDSAPESAEAKSPCLASKASAITEQGFSEAVAA